MKTREDILSLAVPVTIWMKSRMADELNKLGIREGSYDLGHDILTRVLAAAPTPPAAEAPGQEPRADTLRSVIARLESACELLASTRPQAAYIAMIDGGQADALLALDEVRQEARTVLSAPPTYADAEAKRSFNINNYVRVKLTDEGAAELKRQYDDLTELRNVDRPAWTDPRDEGGYCKFQLWDLMNRFGHMMTLGRVMPFDPSIELDAAAIRSLASPAPKGET